MLTSLVPRPYKSRRLVVDLPLNFPRTMRLLQNLALNKVTLVVGIAEICQIEEDFIARKANRLITVALLLVLAAELQISVIHDTIWPEGSCPTISLSCLSHFLTSSPQPPQWQTPSPSLWPSNPAAPTTNLATSLTSLTLASKRSSPLHLNTLPAHSTHRPAV